MAVRAGKLRAIANDILSQLTGWDDDDMIVTYPNTYGMYGTILETSEGFVDVYDMEPANGEDEEGYL